MAINPQGISSLDIVGGENIVDGLNYRVEFSKVLAQNIFVQLRTRVGQAVTGKYIPNGVKAGHVVINRIKRAGMEPRTLGKGTNSGLINSDPRKAIASDQYHVQLLHVYDSVFTIPRVSATLMPVDLVNEVLFNIAGEVYEYIDSSTIATMVLGAAKVGGADGTGYRVELASTPNYLDAIRSAVKLLKQGDITNGISIFEPTAILARPGFAMDLLSSAGVIAGGSNFAQEMIAKGALSPDAAYMQFGVGTKGMVFSYPVIEVPDLIFDLAAEWFKSTGTDAGEVAQATAYVGKIQALVVADLATVRGIADEFMDVRQSTELNATNLLPLFQWGVETLYGKGIVPIVANGAVEITLANANKLQVVGKGSF